MRISAAFSPLGTSLSKIGSASLGVLMASAISAQASTVDLSASNDNADDGKTLAFFQPYSFATGSNTVPFEIAQSGNTALFDAAFTAEANTTPVWNSLLPGNSFSNAFLEENYDEISAILALSAENHNRVQATLTSNEDANGIVYATIEPVGVTVDEAPLTFTHVAGPVGVLEETLKGGHSKRYVGAFTGIDTDALIMEQVDPDPRGIHPVGTLVSTQDPDIKVSENARVAAMFMPEKDGGLEELQISVGYDMLDNEDIKLSLIGADGQLVQTIDANDFQVKKVPDFLVLVIKDNPEALKAIYDNMQADGSFNVEARSPMGRKVLGHFGFGEGFGEHLEQGYAALETPGFFFSPSQEFKRRVAYDPHAEPVAHDIQKCVFLGLQDMSDAQLEDIKVVMGTVTDGTATLPRDFTALVALDKNFNLIAAGSHAWWGANYQTNQLRLSGSSPTRFTTNGGNVFSGCTKDNVTPLAPPVAPPTYYSTPGTPSIFVSVWPNPPGRYPHGWTPGGHTPHTPTDTPKTPAPVDLPPTLPLSIGALLLLDSLANGGKGRRGAVRLATAPFRRREDEVEAAPQAGIV